MKNPFKKTLAFLAAGLIASALTCQQAQAGSITGSIDIGGSVTYNTQSLATATQVTTFNSAIVTNTNGSFTSVALGSAVTFAQPYVFNLGTVGTPLPGPGYSPFWQVGGFTFNLTSSHVVTQTNTDLIIAGIGTISGNGFDVTNGTWRFSSNQSNGATQPSFGFTSNTAAVPEGGSALALLGLGLVAVEALRRKLAAA